MVFVLWVPDYIQHVIKTVHKTCDASTYFTQSTMCPFPLKIAVKNIMKEKLPKHWLLCFTMELSVQEECIREAREMIEICSCSLQQILLIFIVGVFSAFQKARSRAYRKSIVLLRIRIYEEKDLTL